MWTIFKVFTASVTILFLFYVWAFGCEARGILVSQTGTEPAHSALEGHVSNTGPPGESQSLIFDKGIKQLNEERITFS